MELIWSDILIRLGAAIFCGGIVGWERGRQEKAAGLRTHILVSLGAAAFTLIAIELPRSYAETEKIEMDPTRIVQGIIGGIGFLGAGAIFRTRSTIHGLTTASGIWVIAAAGVASGFGFFMLAIPLAVMIALINGFFVLFDPKKDSPEESVPPPESQLDG
ncbi:MgtC/SapB family protein [Rubinisphaera margarita]|uniref:MgtC/SapB family protein n=1 Tax=Rubinisphaera margarita TaxID=2909586 RepID=UPI001EE806FE|nr:MgtC/SapB family protein [Rubinisphaera margarita]MCG6156484.1 MgtC/SapB family protein [Rubinisphaera margarita]